MFSIIIPLYNKAHTIERTLGSVLQQTFTNFEVIIVNDGSTDNGVEVIRKNFTDKRIRIINQENQGVSAARNKGVKEANSEYIAFLDGDDEWLPDYLARMHDATLNYPEAGMFCCAGIIKHANGETSERLAKKYSGQICEIDFFENPGVFLHTSASIIKRSSFYKTLGFPVGLKRHEDFALFFSVALLDQVVYCGYKLSIYNGGVEGQATSTPFNEVLPHIIRRYNFVEQQHKKLVLKHKTYIIYTNYEFRHQVLSLLKQKNNVLLTQFLKDLDTSILNRFTYFEKYLYKNPGLHKLAVLFIYITKLRWRLRGFPRVQ